MNIVRHNRERALERTNRAKAAARAGDCEMVRALSTDVHHLAAYVHATVFVGTWRSAGAWGIARRTRPSVPDVGASSEHWR